MTFVLQHKVRMENQISSFLAQFGTQSLSYHTLQSELSYYRTLHGYIAYREFNGETIVLGDPIANSSDYAQIVEQFLQFRPACSFIQVSKKMAQILARQTFSINHFGDESQIALPYLIQGKQKKEIRNLVNSAKRENIKVREILNRDELHSLINSDKKYAFNKFFPHSRVKEYSFLSRTLSHTDEKDVRIFGGFHENALVCYSLFDPIYEDEKIIGYSEAITRQATNTPKGSRSYTLIEAMGHFESEQIKFVNIGLLPFYPEQKADNSLAGYSNGVVKALFMMLYKTSPMVSNFAGLSFHKSRYRGELIPKYFATNSSNPYKTLLCIYKLTSGNWLPFF